MNPKEEFLRDLEKIKTNFVARIKMLLSGNIDRVELARSVAELDFFLALRNEGLDKSLDEFLDAYDEQLKELLEIADKEKVATAFKINYASLEILKDQDADILLGRAKDYSSVMKRGLLLGVIEGRPFADITKQLTDIPLTTVQINSAVTTGFNDYGRALTAVTFDDKAQRFLYVGTINERSSKQCAWLLVNQDMNGYTKAEIDKGIHTPFGVINWNGRIPNFNCDDMWRPATKEIIKRARQFSEENAILAERVYKR